MTSAKQIFFYQCTSALLVSLSEQNWPGSCSLSRTRSSPVPFNHPGHLKDPDKQSSCQLCSKCLQPIRRCQPSALFSIVPSAYLGQHSAATPEFGLEWASYGDVEEPEHAAVRFLPRATTRPLVRSISTDTTYSSFHVLSHSP